VSPARDLQRRPNTAIPDGGRSTSLYPIAKYVVVVVCELPVDLTQLKPFERKQGLKGPYYRVEFEVVVNFGSEIMYALVKDEKVFGSVSTAYYD
jgi:hypothetical protein